MIILSVLNTDVIFIYIFLPQYGEEGEDEEEVRSSNNFAYSIFECSNIVAIYNID